MDPDAAVSDFLKELMEENPDRDRLVELLNSLSNWIGGGGYLPNYANGPMRSVVCSMVRAYGG